MDRRDLEEILSVIKCGDKILYTYSSYKKSGYVDSVIVGFFEDYDGDKNRIRISNRFKLDISVDNHKLKIKKMLGDSVTYNLSRNSSELYYGEGIIAALKLFGGFDKYIDFVKNFEEESRKYK